MRCSEGAAGVGGDGDKAHSLGIARPGVTDLLGSSTPWLTLLHFGDSTGDPQVL